MMVNEMVTAASFPVKNAKVGFWLFHFHIPVTWIFGGTEVFEGRENISKLFFREKSNFQY